MDSRSKRPTYSVHRTAVLTAIVLVVFQIFSEQTMAKEKKTSQRKVKKITYPAAEKVVPSVPSNLPAELIAIEKKYLDAKTLEADFIQKDDIKLTSSKKESSGVLMIRHPNQFRWETLKPDKNLLVSDGKRFWFYTPPFEAGERGQVIERKTSEVQSELANALLSGAFSKIHGLEVKKLSATRFRLIPADGVAGTVKSTEIEIDLKKNVIEKLYLEHTGGNKTEISLLNVKLAEKMNDAFFTFTTPPGTDVIRE